MKNTFRIESLAFTINNQPVELKGVEFTNEANAQELATSGGFINQLVETIGNIAERFDNKPIKVEPNEIEVEPKVEPVKVKPQSVNNDFCEIKVKEKTKTPELPTATFSGGEPIKPLNVTKEWRKIPIPEEMKKTDNNDEYRWEGPKGLLGDSVSVNGSTYGAIYIHIYGMKRRCFIVVRNDNVKFEDDITAVEFQDFLETIDIPSNIKDYIKKVIEL